MPYQCRGGAGGGRGLRVWAGSARAYTRSRQHSPNIFSAMAVHSFRAHRKISEILGCKSIAAQTHYPGIYQAKGSRQRKSFSLLARSNLHMSCKRHCVTREKNGESQARHSSDTLAVSICRGRANFMLAPTTIQRMQDLA